MNINEINRNFAGNKTTAVPVAKTFLSGVFGWMFLALGITAITSWLFASSPQLLTLLYTQTGMTILGWVVLLAPFGFVLWIMARFNRMSASKLALLFVVYSILMGMSLSFIFLAYTSGSIATTFLVTAGMFGFMAILGYTTKTDLTKFGSIMIMGVVGLVIAMLVNMFMHSSGLDYLISFIGVLVFTGLTAYDVQKLKRIGAGMVEGAEGTRKMTIMGALTLYLDFINLFLFLLRFFGNRR
jgi:FtsH-binding integral membrane protein